jgi:pimeloyl-ACP methyl ester carboxylesterase
MTSLHRYRSGTGLPIVLLHAFPLDHRMWDGVAAALPATRTVLAVDLPGTPGNAQQLPPPSLDTSALRVADALAAAGVERAVVAGLSMGGYVALALAESRPELVAGLGLLDTKSVADTPEAAAARLRIADEAETGGTVDPVRPMSRALLGETSAAARPELVERVDGWIGDQVPAGVAWSQRAMAARPDRTRVIADFPGPVTVVVGDEDGLTPLEQAQHMVEAAMGAQLVVVPRAGHLSAVEDPETVADALEELANRVEQGA